MATAEDDRRRDAERGLPEEQDRASGGLDRRRMLGVAAGAAGVGLAAAVAGCGGSRSGSGSARGAASAVSTPTTATRTSAPAAVAEEDLAGNDDWRITSGGSQRGIEGYADKVSVLPGEAVNLRVSTTSHWFRASAYRMGWYTGAEARRVWQSDQVPGTSQGAANFDSATRMVYTSWHDSLTVPTTGWPEGAYLLRLDAASGTRSYAVSFDRPYDDGGAEKFLIYERAVVALAARLHHRH